MTKPTTPIKGYPVTLYPHPLQIQPTYLHTSPSRTHPLAKMVPSPAPSKRNTVAFTPSNRYTLR